MSNLDNVNGAFSAAVYKKLQKQISPLVEKLVQLQEDTRLIETTPGPKGDKGIKGDQGIAGQDGERGLIGEQGLHGIQGDKGKKGLIGEQGLQGIQGPQGDKGDHGIQGIQGVTGDQGIQGVKGDTGDKGDTGQQGVKGEAGQQGIQGNSGKDGLTGKIGPQGIQGLDGDTGAKGDTGETGVDGKPGPQGIQGDIGPQGEAGVDGNDGKDAELPDIDKIIEPHFVKVKKELDSYVIKSDKDFTNWKSVINNQISNNAGGGEVWLSRLNDVQQSTAKVDGNFLKYDASQKKWVGVDIVAGAPEQLDTLNELAEALNDDENFAASVTSSIAAKASQTDLDTHTGNTNNPHSVTATQVGLGNVEDKSAATIISEIVDGDIPSTIARDSELPTKSSLGLSNVTDESKATMFTNPVFTGTISSSGAINFGDRSSNDTLINVESNSGDLTLFRAASFADTVGISIKYLGSGSGDENIFEIATDGGGSFKMDQSGDVGINAEPIDGVGLSTTSISASGSVILDVPDNGGAPATTAIIDINGYEGRGAGIKIQDSKNSAAGASNREWFIGSGYSQSGFNIGYASDGNQSSYVAQNKLTIDTSGNVGVGTATPSEALDVNGNILSNGVIRAFNSTQEAAQLEVGRNSNEFIEMRVSDPDCFITANQDSDSNAAHHFVLDRAFSGTGPNDFEIRKGGTAQVTVDTDGGVKFSDYAAVSRSTDVSALSPIQNNQPGTNLDTVANLCVDSTGNVVRGSQEATWTFDRTQLNALTTSKVTLLSAPGAGKCIVVEESNWLIEVDLTKAAQSTSVSLACEIVNGQTQYKVATQITAANLTLIAGHIKTANTDAFGLYSRDVPELDRISQFNKPMTIRAKNSGGGSNFPDNFASVRLKIKYRVFDKETF